MLTSLPPAWMTRSASGRRAAPRSPRGSPGRSRSSVAWSASVGDGDPVAQLAVDLDRHLAVGLGGRGHVDVRPGLACGSTTTARRPRPAAAHHSSSVMCGAAGASISSSSRIASSHAARARDRRPAVADQGVGQLHELGDHRVEAERLVVGGHVAQGPMGGAAQRPGRVRLGLAGGQLAGSGSPASRPCGSRTTVQTRFRKRWTPPMPVGLHGPPWSHGPMNIRNRRTVSAP